MNRFYVAYWYRTPNNFLNKKKFINYFFYFFWKSDRTRIYPNFQFGRIMPNSAEFGDFKNYFARIRHLAFKVSPVDTMYGSVA